MNCALCGKRLSRFEMGKWQKDGHPICRDCRKEELREIVEKASASQIEVLKLRANDTDLIEELLKEGKLKEQAAPKEPEKDEHGCIIGVETWNTDLHQCTKIETTPPTEPEKDEHGCIIGVEKWNTDLHQCVRIEKHPPTQEQVVVPYQPAPEIPAQPVVPVGPITVEQKIAAIEDELAKIRLDIANILGMLGQREGRR